MKDARGFSEEPADSRLFELRRQAKEAARGRPVDGQEFSPEEMRRLIHELQVHEIELEMQNEELRRVQQEVEVSRDRYADLYDFAPVGYMTVGEKGLICEANLTAAILLDEDRGALIGQPLSRFVAGESQDAFYLNCRRVLNMKVWQMCEIRMVKQDGTPFHAQLESLAVEDSSGNYSRYRTAISDITERKKAEQALQKAHDELERRVEERTAELKALNEQLQREMAERKQAEQALVRLERLRALGEMSQGVAHNFNNIMAGVLGNAQIIQITTADPQVVEYAERVVQCALRSRELVQRLSLSTHSDEREVGPVDADRAVREAIKIAGPRWRDEAERKGTEIDVVTQLEEAPPIAGTQAGLLDILINLLFNAVDAMPEGGTITIRTEAAGRSVRLKVSDTGIGMDEETRVRVFEPFFTTKADVGTGLGLSTVYNTVTRWGGDIDVASAPGEGTTFTVRLPVWMGTETETEDAAELRKVRRAKILVVDDEEVVHQVISDFLSKAHEVEAALNGQEAMERFQPGVYDVALIDLGMPGLPGDQVAREMRHMDPSVATVLMTGWNLEEGNTIVSTFDLQIQKPFTLGEVEDVVAEAVELHDERAEMKGRR